MIGGNSGGQTELFYFETAVVLQGLAFLLWSQGKYKADFTLGFLKLIAHCAHLQQSQQHHFR